MRRLVPSPQTVQWGYFDPVQKPVATVSDGEVLRIRTVSGYPDDPAPPPEIPVLYAEVHDRGPRAAHIMTGPLWVDGAQPGNALQVDILSIELGAAYGYNWVKPLWGILPDDVAQPEKRIIPIDLETGQAEVVPGVRVQTHPFFGVLGVAPPPAWGRIDSVTPRAHGGNMDNKDLVGGTTLFLPVWVEGALFAVGDGHAAQGDGEVNAWAIETALEGQFRLRVRKDLQLSLPMAVTPTHLMAMGFHEDLDRAAQIGVRSLIDLLVRYCGVAWTDAYRLASVAADLHVTQIVNWVKGVHVMFPREIVAQLPQRPPFLS